MIPEHIFHCTTPKKAKLYAKSGCIKSPVRGFSTLMAAMAWCVKTGRTVIYQISTIEGVTYKLPEHHNQFGTAWWIDSDIVDYHCVFSAEKDA